MPRFILVGQKKVMSGLDLTLGPLVTDPCSISTSYVCLSKQVSKHSWEQGIDTLIKRSASVIKNILLDFPHKKSFKKLSTH